MAGQELFGVIPNPDMQQLALAGWSQPGGLSLPFELPTAGSKLVFTKTGGDARLALNLRTEQGVQRGLGYVWAIVWIGLALFVLVAVRGAAGRQALLTWSPVVVAVAAAGGVLLLARPLNYLCLCLFFVSVMLIAWQLQRSNLKVS